MKTTLKITPVCDWLANAKRPLIVAGPCSAESEEQMITTAKEIAAINKNIIFRAGIWKPRTRPNSFEGLGNSALPWMKKVKEETGLLTATEVANAHHVESCLENKIDILWIGARTSVNPFSVQEIADALQGTDIPVFVKNPVTPDLQLWIGAIERLNKAGITKIVAVHRAFIRTKIRLSEIIRCGKWQYNCEQLVQICQSFATQVIFVATHSCYLMYRKKHLIWICMA